MTRSKRYVIIANEILQIYDVKRMKTISILATNNCRIALTTDLWTASSQRKGYMVVTAHFIDELWCLQNRILRYDPYFLYLLNDYSIPYHLVKLLHFICF